MTDSVRWIGRTLVKGCGLWLLRQGISGAVARMRCGLVGVRWVGVWAYALCDWCCEAALTILC
ncbi:hypothetical protein NEIELOOT_03153 [Neisseria elongata subsp. glycolytica ATCC 29315]|uniref:Uncharacterized protein n=1 Tax=Neisseria elongata subsp. glycolytica ATCC 29315 TaxID=546263 RepID=D4DVN1_NEIEG|nr:hypothetical protein NEIELOOT_03153 [Neisseria elongata subsp. glycolytica ATCC 29315]